jgi:hypothetical protein
LRDARKQRIGKRRAFGMADERRDVVDHGLAVFSG